MNLGRLFFRLGADTSGLKKAETEANRFANNTERSFKRASSASRTLGIALSGLVSIEFARRTVMLADSYNDLTQRLKTATKATGDFEKVSKAVFKISNKNGTQLAENVNLFQELARTAGDIGATTDEVLELTDVVGQLGVIGGSSTQQMKDGLRQFSQGIAAGIFRAEEMNSILENIPEVAARIAKGLNLTQGKLRLEVIEGNITSKDVFQSLLKQSKEIKQEFQEIPPTVGRSFVMLSNSFMKFLGNIDKGAKITRGIANFFIKAANFFQGDFKGIKSVMNQIAYSVEMWKQLISSIGISTKGIASYFKGYAKEIYNFVVGIYKAVFDFIIKLPIHLKHMIITTKENLNIFFTNVGSTFDLIIAKFVFGWNKVKNVAISVGGSILKVYAGMSDSILRFFANTIKGVAGLIDKLPGMDGSQILKYAERIENVAKAEDTWSNMIRRGNVARKDRQNQLRKDIKEIEKLRQLEIAMSEKRITDSKMGTWTELSGLVIAKRGDEDGLTEKHQKLLDKEKEFNELRKEQQVQADLENAEIVKNSHENRQKAEEDHQNKLTKITDRELKKRNKLEGISGFLGVDLTRKIGDLTLREQGSMFRNQIEQAAEHSKEFFAIKKALAIATALIEGPRAILSAYSFGTEIGGPVLGAVFAGVAAAATAVQISAIMGSSFRGGKASGGSVFAGGMYRVNENGPEMLTSGNKDYLLMGGKSGMITSNDGMSGNTTQAITVNVYTQEGQTARVENNEEENKLNIFIENISENLAGQIRAGSSTFSDTLESQYGLSRSPGLAT